MEFTKITEVPIAEEISVNAHSLIEDGGKLLRGPVSSGGGGYIDRLIRVDARQVVVGGPDEYGDYDYEWEVETEIPMDEIIALINSGKMVAFDVYAQPAPEDMGMDNMSISRTVVPISLMYVEATEEGETMTMAMVGGMAGLMIVECMMQGDYVDWYISLGIGM